MEDSSESPQVKRADPVFYSLHRHAEIDPSKDIPASAIQSSVDFGLLERLEFEESMIDDKSAEKFSRSEAMKRFSSQLVLKKWKIKGKDNQIKDLIVMWDSGAGTNVMNEEMADDLINTGFGVGHPIEPIKLSGISGVPNLIKKELIVDVVKGNSAERIALLISSSSGITVPLISTKTLEILDQLKDEKEESWKIQDASGYSLYLRCLEPEEKKDNEEQTHVFEIDWDFKKETVNARIWDPGICPFCCKDAVLLKAATAPVVRNKNEVLSEKLREKMNKSNTQLAVLENLIMLAPYYASYKNKDSSKIEYYIDLYPSLWSSAGMNYLRYKKVDPLVKINLGLNCDLEDPESERLIETLDDFPMIEGERPKDAELSQPRMVDDEMKGNAQIPIDQATNDSSVKNSGKKIGRNERKFSVEMEIDNEDEDLLSVNENLKPIRGEDLKWSTEDLEQLDYSKYEVKDAFVKFRGNLVIPPQISKKVLKRLHDRRHNGVKKLIEELRRHNFHVINAEKIAKEICECCIPCRRVKKAPVVKRGHLPEQKVLETIAMDFFEMNGQDFLLIVDLGSRYTEAYPIKSQSSRQVIDLVTKWGERLGYPVNIPTDNGTSFKSVEFQGFCQEKGINNLYTPVYSPQSNGLAERYVGLFKENLKLLYLGNEKPESLELACAKIAGKLNLGREDESIVRREIYSER